MSENGTTNPPPSSAQGDEDNHEDNNNINENFPPIPSAPPKNPQQRCISAPIRPNKNKSSSSSSNNNKPAVASCLPPFPSRGAGSMRSTSAPQGKSSNILSAFSTTASGWQIADPSLGMMRFTDATFSALLRESSVERDPNSATFDFWGESGAPDPQEFSLVIQESFQKEPEIVSKPPPQPLTDERGVPFCPTCKGGMLISSSKRNGYEAAGLFECNKCSNTISCSVGRWWCEDCNDDFCFSCYHQPTTTADGHDDSDAWICHLCHHRNDSFFRECAECKRRRRRPLEKDANEEGKIELLSYEEFKQETDQDKEIIDAQKEVFDVSMADAKRRKLLADIAGIPQDIMDSSWDPLQLNSFGISSAVEAHLCLLDVTNEVGYDLTVDDLEKCRVERGVRLPLIIGDTVTHESRYKGRIGSVVNYDIDDNIARVGVRFNATTDSGEAYENYSENVDEDDGKFDFEVEKLVRRSPEEIWLRNDAARLRDAVGGGEHPNQFASLPSPGEEKMQDAERKMPALNTNEESKQEVKEISDGSADDDHDGPQCCACLESKPVLFSELCKKSEDTNSTSCGVFFCRGCLQRHCEMTVVDTRYSAGPVRCPGPGCGRRLPMELWHDLVSRVSLLQYIHAPRQLMAIRCPSCDQVRGLFPRLSIGCKRKEVYEEILKKFLPKSADPREVMKELVEAWHEFAVGTATPEETVDAIEAAGRCGSEEELLFLMLGDMYESYEDDMEDDDGNVDPLAAAPRGLLSLVCDVERRAALALALLRKHPFISLRCCCNPVCFKCKVDGHHTGQTCEERQAAEMEIEAQFCPQCGVPTIRSEGCNHIVCVCGAHWTWEGESDY